jgi:tetratricopeptide (TPR) repeat protein
MTRLMIVLIFLINSAQMSLAASSGGSSSSSSSSSSSGSSSSGSSSSGSSSSGSSSYSHSNDGGNQPADPFDKAYQLINTEDFSKAHEELKTVNAGGRGADRYNLLGFTARKSGDLVGASKYYAKALELNAKHIGALQYQGELFITLGEIENAKKNLVKIEKICWLFSCNEQKLLKTAIEEAVGS